MADGSDPSSESITVRLVDSLAEVDRDAWDGVANPPGAEWNPFVSWDFLEALEASGCVALETGWAPRHLLVEDGTGALLGAAPAYLKGHSRGEFVFDYGWADAFERAGGRYYPKLQVAVPFTPVTGPRMLSPTPAVRELLRTGLCEVAAQMGLSSVHVTFPTGEEWSEAGAEGFLQRMDQQFIWRNREYQTFDDFLADLASRKRKAVRKERAAAAETARIVRLSGDELTPAHWDVFFECYLDTGDRKWGDPYLNREFFDLLHERMADKIVLVMAYDGDAPIASALNILGSDALYGRYWGRLADAPFLHFELCYYQAIEEAIARGLSRVEAGAQGAHKLARGYAPEPVYSYHWIAHEGLRDAVAHYLEAERPAVEDEIEALGEHAPFKKG
ncbi:MAG: GNAT family N-acetyltransferase [Maricaulaceae bacterium]|jgi:predicted N-acyltransferase